MSYLLVLDLEATCDEVETDAISGENREMIEIGAVKIDLATGEEVAHFQSFVRPVVNPTLTDFCKNLLGITQEDVDQAGTFAEVEPRFREWAGNDVIAWASWGNYDVFQWSHDAKRYGLEEQLPWDHINLKKAFGKAMGMKRRGIGGAYAELGLDMGGERHRGLSDARLIARLIREVPQFRGYLPGLLPA